MVGVYPTRVRIRLPEAFADHAKKNRLAKPLTAYEVAKRSGGRIIPSTLYRLTRQGGRVKMFDGDLLEALCDVLDVEPGELLGREGKKRRVR